VVRAVNFTQLNGDVSGWIEWDTVNIEILIYAAVQTLVHRIDGKGGIVVSPKSNFVGHLSGE